VHLSSLKSFGFRNLTNQTVLPSAAANFILGKNGQGKTNLIEAIHFLSSGRSFRTSNNCELICWGQDSASVFGTIVPGTAQEAIEASTEIGVVITPGGKEAYLNGKKINAFSEFMGRFRAITFTPTDLALIKGGPQIRRKFIDRHLSDFDSSSFKAILNYHRALKHKSQLLKLGVADNSQLDTWDLILSENAFAIESGRLKFLQVLQAGADRFLSAFSKTDGPLRISLESELMEKGILSAGDILKSLLKKRSKEIKYQTCLIGPHRDDVVITLNGRDARAFASQGQSRSVALALKLAVIETLEREKGEAPVILLDDVDAELDLERTKALFSLVITQGRQVFVTGTPSTLDVLQEHGNLTIMEVKDGLICQASKLTPTAPSERSNQLDTHSN
jgi:DNA replication and repair protein RecF